MHQSGKNHRFAPARRLKQNRVIPSAVLHVGQLVGLIYRAERGNQENQAYIHVMEEPPILACNLEGNQLYILGGSYRVTGSGIEG
jgi:hypothetical protein